MTYLRNYSFLKLKNKKLYIVRQSYALQPQKRFFKKLEVCKMPRVIPGRPGGSTNRIISSRGISTTSTKDNLTKHEALIGRTDRRHSVMFSHELDKATLKPSDFKRLPSK